MTDVGPSAETMLARLLERLLRAAEGFLASGDLEAGPLPTAEEVRAVDPENRRAASVLQRVATRPARPVG